MTHDIPYFKIAIVAVFVASTVYVHFRGRVRLRFFRQLTDHSTFMAPINCLMYLFSRLPAKPYLPVSGFPELQLLQDHWQDIRAEAFKLAEAGEIKKSDKYNDAGFNSFFKTGWTRFHLKWYGDAHPSARELCPVTTGLLQRIPTVKAAMFAALPPGGRLVTHRDPFAGSVRYHLGLVTPNSDDCYISVDGERYAWRDGGGRHLRRDLPALRREPVGRDAHHPVLRRREAADQPGGPLVQPLHQPHADPRRSRTQLGH